MPYLFTIEIDGEEHKVPEKEITAKEILLLEKLSSDKYYLVQIKDGNKISYKGKEEEKIELYEGAKFISVYIGEKSVSNY